VVPKAGSRKEETRSVKGIRKAYTEPSLPVDWGRVHGQKGKNALEEKCPGCGLMEM